MKPPHPLVPSSSRFTKRLLVLLSVALPCAASCTEAGRDGLLGPDHARAPEAATAAAPQGAAVAGAVGAVGSASAAGSASANASGPPAGPSAPPPGAASAPAGPAVVEMLPVPGDLPASIVKSADGRPPRIVFLPGVCSNAGAYLWGFAEAARAHGGAVAIDGDRPCGNAQDFRSITSDPSHEEPRIQAALAAAGHATPASADIVLIGYSLGATLIENLVKASPERYPRVVLIGSPRDPRLDPLKGARVVATMSCSFDVPGRMKRAARMFEGAGLRSSYFEMPGCTHGNLAEGDRVFSEVLTWISSG
ncbi:alpha/beta hydrolase [Polyangium sorediatum]|uniref:Alpha/beta hydrolase n=1 Tax=Polyangium sorediatum TaxID=889274 RepID=A0ABT6P447_9BACT|nr:alpha/beta hydrolase [Polyangium sorediatum]MDI1435375.1 alpha/beta hydrolase [Polyangium sorediatum]